MCFSDDAGLAREEDKHVVPGFPRVGDMVSSCPVNLFTVPDGSAAFRFEVTRNGESLTADDRKALQDRLATLPQGEGRSLGSLVTTLLQAGYGLRFVRVTNDVLTFNLRMVESLGCELIAALLYTAYVHTGPSVSTLSLLARVAQSEANSAVALPFLFGTTEAERLAVLRFKTKSMLQAFFAGLSAETRWVGSEFASSHVLLTVKSNRVVGYESNAYETISEYLLSHTIFLPAHMDEKTGLS